MYLISPNKKQFKANLHCHSVLSDGKKTPEELKQMYKAHGYDVLAITDHERPHQHQAMNDDDFIMLTGYEAYIRPDQSGHYNRYAKEVHLNLFARDPFNETMICYNECYAKYLRRDGALDGIITAGSTRPREFTNEYIEEFVRTAKENGYIVAYNHPYWSMEDEADIIAHDCVFSMEMCNYSSFVTNGIEYCGPLYDKILTAGKRIFVHGADDNHNVMPEDHPDNDSYGSFTMIMPEKFTYGAMIDAMEKGEMYASMGPVFNEISLEGDKLHIECSGVRSIYAYTGSKKPCWKHAMPGETITSADFTVDPEARYLRISVQDSGGRWADTRGPFRDEIGFPPLNG